MFWFTVVLLFFLSLLVLASSASEIIGKHKILGEFSLQRSLKVFEYKENRLNTLNGVRALSMLWVIMGHEYSFNIPYSANGIDLEPQISNNFFLIVEGGLMAVDTFFFVGGFLAAYAVLREKWQSIFKYPLAIVNRYLRLVPAYFIAILIYYTLFPHGGSGPFWKNGIAGTQFCGHMWRSLLFVDNLIDNGIEMCMGWGWYLQNDMQIFVYSMLLLALYSRSKLYGFMVTTWSILASLTLSMASTYQNHYHYLLHIEDFYGWGNYLTYLYAKPWIRCPPYLYGLLLGILYTEFLQE